MAVFGSNAIPVKIPKTACLTGCSHKSPSAQTDQTGLGGGQPTTQRWKHRAIGRSRLGESLSGARGQLRHGSEESRMGNHWLSPDEGTCIMDSLSKKKAFDCIAVTSCFVYGGVVAPFSQPT
ncbi:Uncharacterized protein HZ326_21929 [Fusarium oxysporum f. sp. albedinis]|nr:Uncharacterized protein HZ326_21929 [Fusarium oxysporum f. sp. albedinis]